MKNLHMYETNEEATSAIDELVKNYKDNTTSLENLYALVKLFTSTEEQALIGGALATGQNSKIENFLVALIQNLKNHG